VRGFSEKREENKHSVAGGDEAQGKERGGVQNVRVKKGRDDDEN